MKDEAINGECEKCGNEYRFKISDVPYRFFKKGMCLMHTIEREDSRSAIYRDEFTIMKRLLKETCESFSEWEKEAGDKKEFDFNGHTNCIHSMNDGVKYFKNKTAGHPAMEVKFLVVIREKGNPYPSERILEVFKSRDEANSFISNCNVEKLNNNESFDIETSYTRACTK
jgi:hypothetical protein